MNQSDVIKTKLEIVRKFLSRFPDTHVGGSIGLFLHGIDLKRSYEKSDIDLVTAIPLSFAEPLDIENTEDSSQTEDFEYSFRTYPKGYDFPYTKIEIAIRKFIGWDVIEYDGYKYRVSKLNDIYFFKAKYAMNGVEKHIDDFITIATGVRPEREKKKEPILQHSDTTDDLPF